MRTGAKNLRGSKILLRSDNITRLVKHFHCKVGDIVK